MSEFNNKTFMTDSISEDAFNAQRRGLIDQLNKITYQDFTAGRINFMLLYGPDDEVKGMGLTKGARFIFKAAGSLHKLLAFHGGGDFKENMDNLQRQIKGLAGFTGDLYAAELDRAREHARNILADPAKCRSFLLFNVDDDGDHKFTGHGDDAFLQAIYRQLTIMINEFRTHESNTP